MVCGGCNRREGEREYMKEREKRKEREWDNEKMEQFGFGA